MVEVTADPEEIAPGSPPRAARTATLALMVLTIAIASLGAVKLWGEATFALREPVALELGRYAEAPLEEQHVETFARFRIAPLPPGQGVTFSRPLEKLVYRAVGITAGGETRIVIYPVAPAVDGVRFVPPELVAGRLTRWSGLGPRFAGLKRRLTASGLAVDDATWVLIDGTDPVNHGWSLGLEALLLGFIAFCVGSVVRVVRSVG